MSPVLLIGGVVVGVFLLVCWLRWTDGTDYSSPPSGDLSEGLIDLLEELIDD